MGRDKDSRADVVRPVTTAQEVIAQLEGATTLMLCDVPMSLGGRGVVDLLLRNGLLQSVDYLYLPRGYHRKSARRCSGSISAFVNFGQPEAAQAATRVFHGLRVLDRQLYVCRAQSQGVAENLMHFRQVRANHQLLETSWPWVRQRGALVETEPKDVARILGIEQEVERLRKRAAAKDSSPAKPEPRQAPSPATSASSRDEDSVSNIADPGHGSDDEDEEPAWQDDARSASSWVTDDGFDDRRDNSHRWVMPLSLLSSTALRTSSAQGQKPCDKRSDFTDASSSTRPGFRTHLRLDALSVASGMTW